MALTHAIFAAVFDSQLKWCLNICDELERRGVSCRIIVPDIRSALSAQQIIDAGAPRVERMTWDEMMRVALSNDIFVSALAGPLTRRISMELHEQSKADGRVPPVLVAGWVGVIIEKLEAGYLDRCGCDVVAVNSQMDWDRFKRVAEYLNIPTDNMLLTGLPYVPNEIAPQKQTDIKTVLFADQPTVPKDAWERLYLYRRLIDYANAHPDRKVILKPRHRLDEDTFHRMKHHPEDMLRKDAFPRNFEISYEPISSILDTVDLLITMSSTAALEAVASGCRVGLVLDLGVHERYGNQVFFDSGLMRTFDAIIKDDIGIPEPIWLDGFFPQLNESPAKRIVDRTLELVGARTRPSQGVWSSEYFKAAYTSFAAANDLEDEAAELIELVESNLPLKTKVKKWGKSLVPPILLLPIRAIFRWFRPL